jgi:hypothetical protein
MVRVLSGKHTDGFAVRSADFAVRTANETEGHPINLIACCSCLCVNRPGSPGPT